MIVVSSLVFGLLNQSRSTLLDSCDFIWICWPLAEFYSTSNMTWQLSAIWLELQFVVTILYPSCPPCLAIKLCAVGGDQTDSWAVGNRKRLSDWSDAGSRCVMMWPLVQGKVLCCIVIKTAQVFQRCSIAELVLLLWRAHAHTHARTHARTHAHTRVHTQTHTRTHARTHARTHTHKNIIWAESQTAD